MTEGTECIRMRKLAPAFKTTRRRQNKLSQPTPEKSQRPRESKQNTQPPRKIKRTSTKQPAELERQRSSKLLRKSAATRNRAIVVASNYALESTTTSTDEDEIVRKSHVPCVSLQLRFRHQQLHLQPRRALTIPLEILDRLGKPRHALRKCSVPMAQENNDRECDSDEGGTQGQAGESARQSDIESVAPSEDFLSVCEAGTRRLQIVGSAGEEDEEEVGADDGGQRGLKPMITWC
jgi:hypothetical protein